MNAHERSLKIGFINNYVGGIFLIGLSVVIFLDVRSYVTDALGFGVLVVATFLLTVARVKLEGEHLTYQRWWRKHSVPCSEIVACGEDTMFGYVRFRRYVFPWGRIYFARAQSSNQLFGWDKQLVSAIRDKANGG
jgi:hypothetical protein